MLVMRQLFTVRRPEMHRFEIHVFAGLGGPGPVKSFHDKRGVVDGNEAFSVHFETVEERTQFFEKALGRIQPVLKTSERETRHDIELKVIGQDIAQFTVSIHYLIEARRQFPDIFHFLSSQFLLFSKVTLLSSCEGISGATVCHQPLPELTGSSRSASFGRLCFERNRITHSAMPPSSSRPESATPKR